MRDQSGWPRRSRLGTFQLPGTFQLLGPSSRIAQVWRRVVQSVGAALVLCAGLARFGRHGEAAWCGQEDTGGTRAAFRAGGRQLAFRHWPQLCEGPALLAHIFVGRHRPPASSRNASCGGLVRRDCRKLSEPSRHSQGLTKPRNAGPDIHIVPHGGGRPPRARMYSRTGAG